MREAWFDLHCSCEGSPLSRIKAKNDLTVKDIRAGILEAKCGKCLSQVKFVEVLMA